MCLFMLLLFSNFHPIFCKDPPPNPLGDASVGLTQQYHNLNDPNIVAKAFDVSSHSAQMFNPDYPPLFIDLARKAVGIDSWKKFIVNQDGVSPCLTNPIMTKAWSGECRVVCSALRDSTAIFSAVFPGPGDRYKDDPWYTIQEDVAHKCYYLTGTLGDIMKVKDNIPERQAQFNKIKEWIGDTIATIGLHGEKHVFGDPNLPTWDQFVRLNGAIENDGSMAGANSPFTSRFVNAQFWGKYVTAKQGYDGYENLALLFKTQLQGAFGEDDYNWVNVMGYEDLSQNEYGYYEAQETFHELRKQIRMMWRTMSTYPQIMPLSFLPYTIDSDIPALWDTTAWLAYKHNDDTQLFIYTLFANSPTSKTALRNAGFDDALIQLATSMSLGGYFHLDYFVVDPDLDPDTHIDSNDCVWDFVERFGYINDLFMEYKYSKQAGKPGEVVEALKTKMNNMWSKLKVWLVANDLKNLLSDLLFPYFPIGNETIGPQKPFFPTSNLPVMVIDTLGIPIPKRDSAVREINGTIKIYENSVNDPPDFRYITMKQHGQSTRLFPKHSYKVTFKHENYTKDDKLHLLGMHKNEDWMFKGFYIDMTLIRDPVAFNFSNDMGMYAPDTRQIELYVIDDGSVEVSYFVHYQGVYCVEEKISRGSHQVDIPKQDPSEDGWTPGSGGYIFSADKIEDGDFLIHLDHAGPIQIQYPGTTKQNIQERDWAKEYLTNFEKALYSDEFLKKGGPNGWDSWIDLDSWVNYWIHGEFVKSVDGFKFSVYFSITGANGVIKMGPPWDYDLGMGNTGWVVDASGVMKLPNLWAFQHQMEIQEPCPAFWFGRMMDFGFFKHAVTMKWKELRNPKTGAWTDERIKIILKDQKDHIEKAANRNFQKWDTLGSITIWPYQPPPVPVSFDGYNDLLETYLLKRAAWMDLNIPRVITHSIVAPGSTCLAGDPEPNCPWQSGFPFPNHPNCSATFWWLRYNWQVDPKFVAHGVDGTACSVQRYLHWEDDQCPEPPTYNPDAAPICFGGCGPDMPGWDNDPNCKGNYEWLMAHWQNDPAYAAAGVDGSPCSVQAFLAQDSEGNKCPPTLGHPHLICVNETCVWDPSYGAPSPAPTPSPTGVPTKSPTNSPTKSPVPPTPAPTPSPSTPHPTPSPIIPTSSPTQSPVALERRDITFQKYDYEEVIGEERNAEFILSCTSEMSSFSVACVEVKSGSVILTLEGTKENLDKAEDEIRASGLKITTFDKLEMEINDSPTKKTNLLSGGGTVALVIASLVIFGGCVAMGLCYVMKQKQQHPYVAMNADRTDYQPPQVSYVGGPRKGSAREHVAQL